MDKNAQIVMLEEALESLIDMLADVETPAREDPAYQHLIEECGRQLGYGAIMSGTEAAWREALKRDGYPPGGEHVAGPCRAVLEKRLAKAREALAKSRQNP